MVDDPGFLSRVCVVLVKQRCWTHQRLRDFSL